jgi:hypothetical protein
MKSSQCCSSKLMSGAGTIHIRIWRVMLNDTRKRSWFPGVIPPHVRLARRHHVDRSPTRKRRHWHV